MVKPSYTSLQGSPDHGSNATQRGPGAGEGQARARGKPARSAPTSGLTAFLRFSTSSSSADGALVMASPGNTLSGLSGHEDSGYTRLSGPGVVQHSRSTLIHSCGRAPPGSNVRQSTSVQAKSICRRSISLASSLQDQPRGQTRLCAALRCSSLHVSHASHCPRATTRSVPRSASCRGACAWRAGRFCAAARG